MSNRKPFVIFVLGPPGSGKGTQCSSILQGFDCFGHVSPGELLRNEMKRPDSQYGAIISQHLANGQLVPSEITCQLIKNAMDEQQDKTHFLIDGFPRSEHNLMVWMKEMASETQFLSAIFLKCPERVCLNRCLMRDQKEGSRNDDNLEMLYKRFESNAQESMPIVKLFEAFGKLIVIDSSPNHPRTVFFKFLSVVAKILQN